MMLWSKNSLWSKGLRDCTVVVYESPISILYALFFTGKPALSDCTQCDGGRYCQFSGNDSYTGLCTAGFYCISGADNPVPQGKRLILMATVHILMNNTNLIDSCQIHLPAQYTSNLIRQKWYWCCDCQRATPEWHVQNKPLVCSIGCSCSSWLFRFSILHSD